MASARGQLKLKLHWCLKSSTTSAAMDETSHPYLPDSQEVWEGVASAAEHLLAEGKLLINCLQVDVGLRPKAWSCMNCMKLGPPVLWLDLNTSTFFFFFNKRVLIKAITPESKPGLCSCREMTLPSEYAKTEVEGKISMVNCFDHCLRYLVLILPWYLGVNNKIVLLQINIASPPPSSWFEESFSSHWCDFLEVNFSLCFSEVRIFHASNFSAAIFFFALKESRNQPYN